MKLFSFSNNLRKRETFKLARNQCFGIGATIVTQLNTLLVFALNDLQEVQRSYYAKL